MRLVYSTAPPRVLHLSRRRLLVLAAVVVVVFAFAVYAMARVLAGYWIESRAPIAEELAADYAAEVQQQIRQQQIAAASLWQSEVAFLRARAAHLTNTGNLLAARLRLPVEDSPNAESLACYDTAKLGDYFDTLERKYELLQAQGAAEVVAAETVPMVRPVVGGHVWQSSGFGRRKDPFTGRQAFHAGYDYAAAVGTTVVAAAAGVVTHSGRLGLYGYAVRIDHGLGVSTLYGHLHTIYAKEKQYVNKGDAIGEVGNTGRSTGPHLHYEVRINGRPRPVRSQINKLNKQRQIPPS